jgi:hypothetical protein
MSHKVALFGEDIGHEHVVSALLRRLARELKVQIEIISVSVRGGHGQVISELKAYVGDLARNRILRAPDLLITATDAKCR